jgi:hypothetical protein
MGRSGIIFLRAWLAICSIGIWRLPNGRTLSLALPGVHAYLYVYLVIRHYLFPGPYALCHIRRRSTTKPKGVLRGRIPADNDRRACRVLDRFLGTFTACSNPQACNAPFSRHLCTSCISGLCVVAVSRVHFRAATVSH